MKKMLDQRNAALANLRDALSEYDRSSRYQALRGAEMSVGSPEQGQ
jgi:hypothetical protein